LLGGPGANIIFGIGLLFAAFQIQMYGEPRGTVGANNTFPAASLSLLSDGPISLNDTLGANLSHLNAETCRTDDKLFHMAFDRSGKGFLQKIPACNDLAVVSGNRYFPLSGGLSTGLHHAQQTSVAKSALMLAFAETWELTIDSFAFFLLTPRTRDLDFESRSGRTLPLIYGHPSTLLYMLAAISVFLACFNLLPIPPLDGGQLVLCGLHALGRSVPAAATQLLIQRVGFVAISVFGCLALWRVIG
jgi:membrane-associated protease RseP (regulator of RpoE activity)